MKTNRIVAGLFCLAFLFLLSSWLFAHEAAEIPRERLKGLFPGATSFVLKEYAVSEGAREALEKVYGGRLYQTDLKGKYYVAAGKENGRTASLGIISFGATRGKMGSMEVGVSLDKESKIVKVGIYEHQEGKALDSPEFLKQFEGKSPADPFKVGKDLKAPAGLEVAARAVAISVKKQALVLSTVVLGKGGAASRN